MVTFKHGRIATLLAAWVVLSGVAWAGFQYDEDSFNKDAVDDKPPAYLMEQRNKPAAPPKNSMPFCEGDVQKYMYYDFRTSESWCISKQEAFRRYIPSNAYKGMCCKIKKNGSSSVLEPDTPPAGASDTAPKAN